MNRLADLSKRNIYINSLLIIGMLFQSYKIFDIAGFEVSLPMIWIIISEIIFIINLIKPRWNTTNFVSVIFIIYILFNYLINYKYSEVTSTMLGIFFIGTIIFTYRDIEENEFNKYVRIYVIIATILSIYGIYQFIGRANNLPFSNLYFDGFMIKGFNWTNPIWIAGRKFIRVNSIYREPSFYSQFTALAIVFIVSNMIKNNKIKFRKIIAVFINLIGMILSFSGTGFIILGAYSIYAFLFEIKSMNKKIKILIFLIILFLLGIIFNSFIPNNDLMNYFIQRGNEILNNSGSGGIRFRGAFTTLAESLKMNAFFGHGMGSREIFFNNFTFGIHGTPNIDSTIPRVGVELGLIGIVLWLMLILTFINKNTKNIYYRAILVFIFVQMINGDYFLQITNWIFIYFINCKICFNKKITSNTKGESHE